MSEIREKEICLIIEDEINRSIGDVWWKGQLANQITERLSNYLNEGKEQ